MQMIDLFLKIAFEHSNILWLLLILPIIFFISKFEPKPKNYGQFPGYFILKAINYNSNIPISSKIWLKILRTLFAFCLIIGFASPYFKNNNIGKLQNTPLLFIVENDVSLGNEINNINLKIKNIISNPLNKGRKFEIISLYKPQNEKNEKNIVPNQAANFKIDRQIIIPDLKQLRQIYEIHYFSNNISNNNDNEFFDLLKSKTSSEINLYSPIESFATIKSIKIEENLIKFDIFATKNQIYKINALDKNGNIIAKFNANDKAANLSLANEKISKIAYFDILGQRNAAKIFLFDENLLKPIVFTPKILDKDQPLISDAHFIWSSLKTFANPHVFDMDKLQKQKPSAIIFGDISGFDNQETKILKNYMENGGIIIRFMGNKAIAKENDEIITAKISNQIHKITNGFDVKPVTINEFAKDNFLYGIEIPQDFKINNNIIFAANSKPDEIYIQLSDGSPYLSMKKFGLGKLFMFHVNAAPIWSNGGLSNLHNEIIRKIIEQNQIGKKSNINFNDENIILKKTLEIDNIGNLNRNFENISFIKLPLNEKKFPNEKYPAGLYENENHVLALNVGQSYSNAQILKMPENIGFKSNIDFKNNFSYLFLTSAFIILFLELFITFIIKSNFQKFLKFALILFSLVSLIPHASYAQNKKAKDDIKLAFVITNDDATNLIAKQGLEGLSLALEQRTNIEPNGTIGINLETDELAKHPIIYWLIPKNGMEISLNAQKSLNKYMQNGGIILIDTQGKAMDGAKAQANLKKAVNGLKIPPIEQVPPQHILKKSFYLLQNFQGFYKNSSLWVETAASQNSSANDGVSPIIIFDGNFARIWARAKTQSMIDIFAPISNDELGIRSGINIFIYALTGQYKGDQIHINSILNRFKREQK